MFTPQRVSVKTNTSKLSLGTFYGKVQQNLYMNLFNKENNACPNNNYKELENILMECHEKIVYK